MPVAGGHSEANTRQKKLKLKFLKYLRTNMSLGTVKYSRVLKNRFTSKVIGNLDKFTVPALSLTIILRMYLNTGSGLSSS
jgi:hypothetical protein